VAARCVGLIVAVLAVLAPARSALAWGALGHRVVAIVAYAHLAAPARAAVDAILEDESFVDASTWADEHKRAVRGSAPWHYVNLPLDASRYDASYCPHDACIVPRIDQFVRLLHDRTAQDEQRLLALRFVIHLVADVHQPMHVGDNEDRGGNDLQLRFYTRGTNLHKLWDRDLLERFSKDEDVWAKSVSSLLTPENVRAWSGGTPADWAAESVAIARQAYAGFTGTDPMPSGTKLGAAYEAAAIPIVRTRLAQAAIRLANVLGDLRK
jgi:hypothetical protein